MKILQQNEPIPNFSLNLNLNLNFNLNLFIGNEANQRNKQI
jgi:hypothetical protein